MPRIPSQEEQLQLADFFRQLRATNNESTLQRNLEVSDDASYMELKEQAFGYLLDNYLETLQSIQTGQTQLQDLSDLQLNILAYAEDLYRGADVLDLAYLQTQGDARGTRVLREARQGEMYTTAIEQEATRRTGMPARTLRETPVRREFNEQAFTQGASFEEELQMAMALSAQMPEGALPVEATLDTQPYAHLAYLGTFEVVNANGQKRELNAEEILREMHTHISIFDENEAAKKDYLNTVFDYLAEQLASPEIADDEKKSLLFKMGESLGTCRTPLLDLLVRESLQMPEARLPISKEKIMVFSEALELRSKVLSHFIRNGIVMGGNEQLEELNNLVTALYGHSEYAERSPFEGILEITGGPNLPFSLSTHTDNQRIKPNQMQAFLDLVCQQDDQGNLKVDPQGRFLFDAQKVERLTYGARQRAGRDWDTFNFEQELNQILRYYGGHDLYYNTDHVSPITDVSKQAKKFWKRFEQLGLDPKLDIKTYFSIYVDDYVYPLIKDAKAKAEVENPVYRQLPLPYYKPLRNLEQRTTPLGARQAENANETQSHGDWEDLEPVRSSVRSRVVGALRRVTGFGRRSEANSQAHTTTASNDFSATQAASVRRNRGASANTGSASRGTSPRRARGNRIS